MKEVCQIEYISVHYKLPVIAEEVRIRMTPYHNNKFHVHQFQAQIEI